MNLRPFVRTDPGEDTDRQQLLLGLELTRRSLAAAYSGFNMTSDPDLTDAFVYEIGAARARHAYLLRQLKDRMPPAAPDPVSEAAPGLAAGV